MSQEVKVTIEWKSNADPMKVQITADADPNEVIGAVGKAMDVIKETPKCRDDEFIHIEQEGGKVKVGFPDGSTRSFPTWHEALDRIVIECEGGNRG